MSVAERFAAWVAEVPDTHAPAARDAARHAIQDVTGCMVAGAGDEGAAGVRTALAGLGQGRSVVVGKLSLDAAPYAALANGMAAHALDFDDTFHEPISHASASLVPALYALGDEIDASGADIVDAYIVGLEIQGALGLALGRSHYEQGWHPTATVGVIGSAAACARLMRLDRARTMHAIALAFSSAAGTKVQFGSMAKPLHAGLAAKNAIEAAKFAAAGVEGHVDALDGPMGMMELYGGPTPPGWDAALAKLGGPLAIERQGLTVKRYPCCAATHRALDAVLDLRAEHGFGADDVRQVDVQVRKGHKQNLRYDDPKNEFEARFSMPYCVAVALRYGAVGLSDFTPAAVARPEVCELLGRVAMRVHDLEMQPGVDDQRVPSIVTVTLADGRTVSASRDLPKGDPRNPLTAAERHAKFDDCCRGFLADADVRALSQAIEGLDALASVRDLTRMLRFEAGCDRGERFERRSQTG